MSSEVSPKALLARLVDVKDLVAELVQDVTIAAEASQSGRPDARRAYVRSVFALVEGALSGMSGYLVEGQAVAGWVLGEKATRILWDAVPDPTVARLEGRRHSLAELAKAAFKTGRSILGDECQADFSGPGYQAFDKAIDVRDRLTHPKRRRDLDVEPEELALVDKARDWFRLAAESFFRAAASELSGRISNRPS